MKKNKYGIPESHILEVALDYLNENPGTPMSELKPALKKIMNPEGEDNKILKGRNDTSFDQKVGNIESHGTRDGLIKKEEEGKRDSPLSLTEAGKKFLRNNNNII